MTDPTTFWKVASTFPANKEDVYPEHTIAQQFDSHRGKVVVEYGCGGGSDALSFLRRGCSVYACDIVPENIATTAARAAEAKLDTRLRTVFLRESAKIPIESATANVISSHGVIHHIERPAPVLDEFYRIMKPNGLLYIMFYTERLFRENETTVRELMNTHNISEQEAFGWITDGQGCPHADFYTEAAAKDLIQSAGFTYVDNYTYHKGLFQTHRAQKA